MSDLNQQRQASASERYRRAIGCLMDNADPLTDMSMADKYRVLGMIAELKEADEAERMAIVNEVFEGKLKTRREFLAAVKERANTEDVRMFFDNLRTEVKLMWAESVKRAEDIRREKVRASMKGMGLHARAAGEPKADDGPAPTVPGGGGPK